LRGRRARFPSRACPADTAQGEGGGRVRRAVAVACAPRAAGAQRSAAGSHAGILRHEAASIRSVCGRVLRGVCSACAPRKRRLADRQRGLESAPPRLPPRPTQHRPVNTGGKWQTRVLDTKQAVTHRMRFGTQCNLRSRTRPEAVHHVETEPAYFTSRNQNTATELEEAKKIHNANACILGGISHLNSEKSRDVAH
jgi:hypothetical protein